MQLQQHRFLASHSFFGEIDCRLPLMVVEKVKCLDRSGTPGVWGHEPWAYLRGSDDTELAWGMAVPESLSDVGVQSRCPFTICLG